MAGSDFIGAKIIIIVVAVTFVTLTSAVSDNYCFSCLSVNNSVTECDYIISDDVTYLVECTGGYCTKTTRSRNGITFYTHRGCVQEDPVEDFSCSTTSPGDYLEIYCACDTSYCNEAQTLALEMSSAIFWQLLIVLLSCTLYLW